MTKTRKSILPEFENQLFSTWEYVLLIIALPIINIVEFYIINGGIVSETLIANKSVIPYFYLAVFVLIIVRTKFNIVQVGILVYFFIYVFYFDSFTLANNASYLIPFVLTCSLLVLPREKKLKLSIIQNNTIIVVYSFAIILYYIVGQNRFFEDRFYLVGFVIPHHFSYYCAIFTLFLLKQGKFIFAIIVTMAGIYVGARSGILVSILCYIYYFLSNPVYKIYLKSACLILGLVGIVSYSTLGFDFLTNNLPASSSDNTRTLLWINMSNQVEIDGLSWENLFGRGPRSSYEYNYNTLGLELWMHNDFFEVFFTLGAVGLIFYLICLTKFFNLFKNWFFIGFIVILIATNGFFTYLPLTIILFFRVIGGFETTSKLKYG